MRLNEETRIRSGLEIHQQLDTGKLFCSCSSGLTEKVFGRVTRKLRVSSSEMGETDYAAQWQSSRDQTFEYEVTENSCLVDLDEEPPHAVNADAISIGLKVAFLLHSSPVNEIHFMRKIVVDGSNTSGFQRTALIALGGYVDVGAKRVRIQSVCCEEDACRKIEQDGSKVVYRLDRLGVPLLEIATEPDIDSPELLKETARRIGMLLRATGRVKRGIGSIREDINISVPGGARVEVKGVQELEMLPRIALNEARRQKLLIEAAEILKSRGAAVERSGWTDVTDLLKGSSSGLIRKATGNNERIGGTVLRGFAGTLLMHGTSVLGRELAQQVRPLGIRGIIHSDELPAYGITQEEKDRVSSYLGASDGDAFVLCAAGQSMLDAAFDAIHRRAASALTGVPEETRDAMEDGSTSYSRPLPGRARMYPETDVLPLRISAETLSSLQKELPEPFDVQAQKISGEFGIHMQQAVQIAEEGWAGFFTSVARRHGNPSVLARILLNYLPEAEHASGKSVLTPEDIEAIMKALSEGRFAKEGAEQIVRCLAAGQALSECIRRFSLSISPDEAQAVIQRIVSEHIDFVKEKGEKSLSALMGIAMKELRGKIDGGTISSMLSREINRVLG